MPIHEVKMSFDKRFEFEETSSIIIFFGFLHLTYFIYIFSYSKQNDS